MEQQAANKACTADVNISSTGHASPEAVQQQQGLAPEADKLSGAARVYESNATLSSMLIQNVNELPSVQEAIHRSSGCSIGVSSADVPSTQHSCDTTGCISFDASSASKAVDVVSTDDDVQASAAANPDLSVSAATTTASDVAVPATTLLQVANSSSNHTNTDNSSFTLGMQEPPAVADATNAVAPDGSSQAESSCSCSSSSGHLSISQLEHNTESAAAAACEKNTPADHPAAADSSSTSGGTSSCSSSGACTLTRAGSNVTGQVKCPSRLRRMSVPGMLTQQTHSTSGCSVVADMSWPGPCQHAEVLQDTEPQHEHQQLEWQLQQTEFQEQWSISAQWPSSRETKAAAAISPREEKERPGVQCAQHVLGAEQLQQPYLGDAAPAGTAEMMMLNEWGIEGLQPCVCSVAATAAAPVSGPKCAVQGGMDSCHLPETFGSKSATSCSGSVHDSVGFLGSSDRKGSSLPGSPGSDHDLWHKGAEVTIQLQQPAAGYDSDVNSGNRVNSSNSYAAALAAAQQLPWPLSWHWPDKMLHSAAAGVRPVSVHHTQHSSSSGSSAGGSSSGRRGSSSRPGSPVSPKRAATADASCSGRSSSRPGSPTKAAADPEQQQQQQQLTKPSELLSAIHAHLVSAPAVEAAFAAATAAVMQQQEFLSSSSSNNSSSSAHLVHEADMSAVASATAAWHFSLQQQFAATFASWDADGDGCLGSDELSNMLHDVLPAGTVSKEEGRYCQVLLDRSGSGLVTPHDLLAAAHTAVTLGVGIIPKARVDISDVLLQLVVMLMQQQQQAGQSIAAQVRCLFHDFDLDNKGRLEHAELGRLFRRLLPAISHQEVRLILSHMSELDPDGTCHVSLKHLVAAVQPVHQAVQQLTSSTSWQKQQAVQQFLHAEAYSPVEAAAAVDVGQTARKQQQLQGASQVEQSNVNSTQWDLPKPPSPVRLIPRPATGSSSSSKAGGSSSVHSDAGTGGLVVAVECDQEVPPVLWPMQELAALLSSNPTALQFAFMQTAAAAAAAAAASAKDHIHSRTHQHSRSSSTGGGSSSPAALQQQLPTQQQQRYSLIPIASLPQLIAAALPGWGGADISYAALQIRCHLNIVANFSLDTPTAAGSSISQPIVATAVVDPPTDLMFAELAATVISAAGTEASAAAGQLPQAVEQLVVDLTDELMSNESSHAKLAAAWNMAAAAAATATENGPPNAAVKLPVVAAVKLLCRQLIASEGLSDIRLLGWLTCLVRQQHLAVQLAAAQASSSSGGAAAAAAAAAAGDALAFLSCSDRALSAEIGLDQFCEVLLQVVQGLLPAEDAALVEDFKQQQQQQQQQHDWDLAAEGDRQTGMGQSNRRARIVFNGSSPTPSDCSPAWCSGEQQQQKLEEGLRSLQSHKSLDKILEASAGCFQPSHLQISAFRGQQRDRSTPGSVSPMGSHFTLLLLDDGRSDRSSSSGGRFNSNGGGLLLPADVQQQREQLDRLRVAQQQAWRAEMLLEHMPWEGAYSPVAAVAAAMAERGPFGSAKVVDILRLSASGFRTSSNASECQ